MIRTVIVDDEPLALNHMENLLSKLEKVEVVRSFSNPAILLEHLHDLDFHVAFLDIEMPGFNGLELAELIQAAKKEVFIVFVTAYRDYAIQAFELHSIDYVLKPLLADRLSKTIQRIRSQMELTSTYTDEQFNEHATLQISCFDEFTVTSNGESLKWKTMKVKELFALFMTHLGTSVNRDTIIELLWPDTNYQKAKVHLHTSISHLRKMLEQIGFSNVLTFADQQYTLELSTVQCDAVTVAEVCETTTAIHDENIQQVEHALSLYSGDFLEKNGYEWATIHAQEIRQKVLRLLNLVIEYFSEKQNPLKTMHYLQKSLMHNPYSEPTLYQLMQVYNDSGHRSDAIKVYLDFKEILLEDLGIHPEKATSELFESIRQTKT